MVKQEKDRAAVLRGCLLHSGKSSSESSRELLLFNTDNASEHHLPWKRHTLPSTFTLFTSVLDYALCRFSGSGKDGLPKQVELIPWIFWVCCFFFLFVKYANGFEWLRNNNLKAVAQRKHAWLLLNTTRNPYSKDYAAGWRLKLTWWSIWINLATNLKSSVSKWMRKILGWISGLDLSLSLICGGAGILLKQANLLKLCWQLK